MNFIEDISKTITMAQLKAFINVLLIPIALLVLTTNLVYSIMWIVLTIAIYLTIKRDTENAREFFNFLLTGLGFGLFFLILILGS